MQSEPNTHLPAPGTPAVSTVVYTRTVNQVEMDSTGARILIDGPDLVLQTPDGRTLVLPLAAELASYEHDLFSIQFRDGKVMGSDELLRVGKVVSTARPHHTGEAPQAPDRAPPEVKIVERVVEKVVEEVIVLEAEPAPADTAEPKAAAQDALALSRPATLDAARVEEAPPVLRSSSAAPVVSADRKPVPGEAVGGPEPDPDPQPEPHPTPETPPEPAPQPDPGQPSQPAPEPEPETPSQPTPEPAPEPETPPSQPEPEPGPPPEPVRALELLQLDARIDTDNREYRGGAASDGGQSNPAPGFQYARKVIDLSGETEGWTVFADDPDRIDAAQMTRVIKVNDAAGAVAIVAGLPDGYHAITYGTAQGDLYGLQPGQVLLVYPAGRHDSFVLTFQYAGADGEVRQVQEMFVVLDDPIDVVRADGAYELASRARDSSVLTGSGDDTVYAGQTTTRIDTGAGDDRIVASASNAEYVGGLGQDTVDYSVAAGERALIVNLAGNSAMFGSTVHQLSGIENIIGTHLDDILSGDDADNHFQAGAGNDTLSGGAGHNILDGGDGIDTVDYANAFEGIDVDLATGTTEGGNGWGGTDELRSIENIIGTRFADRIVGSAGNNVIRAGDGDDVVYGSGGSDLLDGGSGNNVLRYDAFTDPVEIDLALGRVLKADGQDTISGFLEAHGGAGDDTLVAVDGARLFGNAGNDRLLGSAGADYLDGGDGNDTFIGSLGSDTIIGGEGYDTLDYSAMTANLYVDLAAGYAAGLTASTISGKYTLASNLNTAFGRDAISGIDVVEGALTAGINYLAGNAGNNRLVGGNNENYLQGGAGNDILDGSRGRTDWALYRTSTSGVVANLETGTAADGLGGTDTLIGIEGLWGSDFDDHLVGRSSVTTNLLYGGAGNDWLENGTASYLQGVNTGVVVDLQAGITYNDGFGTQDTLVNINRVIGSRLDDVIYGNARNNYISTSDGDDIVYGSAGSDTIEMGNGNDTVDYSGLSQGIVADLELRTVTKLQGGKDTLSGVENITGTTGNDRLVGDAANNWLVGNGGDDVLIGGAGNDMLIGGAPGSGIATASYETSTAGIEVDMGAGLNQVRDGLGGTDSLVQIGAILGSAHNDTFRFATQQDLGRYAIDGAGGFDTLVKSGNGGSFLLDGSVRLSNVELLDFRDSRVDDIRVDLDALMAGKTDQHLTLRVDATDALTLDSAGWAMTDSSSDHQTWAQGQNEVVVSWG